MNNYAMDTLVQVNASFVSVVNNQPVDPTTITITITLPDDSTQEATYPSGGIIRSGTGEYYYQFQTTELGIWIYRWQGQGAVIAASPNGFFRVV